MRLQPNLHDPAALLQGLLPLCNYTDVRRGRKKQNKQFLVIKVLRHTINQQQYVYTYKCGSALLEINHLKIPHFTIKKIPSNLKRKKNTSSLSSYFNLTSGYDKNDNVKKNGSKTKNKLKLKYCHAEYHPYFTYIQNYISFFSLLRIDSVNTALGPSGLVYPHFCYNLNIFYLFFFHKKQSEAPALAPADDFCFILPKAPNLYPIPTVFYRLHIKTTRK